MLNDQASLFPDLEIQPTPVSTRSDIEPIFIVTRNELVDFGRAITVTPSEVGVETNPDQIDWASIIDLCVKDINEKQRRSLEKYPIRLEAFNGRKPLIDYYQEILDGSMYITQELTEIEIAFEQSKLLDLEHPEFSRYQALSWLQMQTFNILLNTKNVLEQYRKNGIY